MSDTEERDEEATVVVLNEEIIECSNGIDCAYIITRKDCLRKIRHGLHLWSETQKCYHDGTKEESDKFGHYYFRSYEELNEILSDKGIDPYYPS